MDDGLRLDQADRDWLSHDFRDAPGVHLAAAHVDTAYITIGDTDLMFSGQYQHRGQDLILSAPDGRRLVIDHYFSAAHPAALASRQGAVLSADVVAALAGPDAPGQYAQAGTPAPEGQVIGKVVRVTGAASVVRNGVTIALNVGDAVIKGDVVQTAKGAALGIGFIDGTAFNLTSGTRMVLNDMVFDAASSNNSALFSVVQGQISFVAGQVAHTGDMQVHTPVATMGIRGTAVRADIHADNGATYFSVLREPDGRLGRFELIDNKTGKVLALVDSDQATTIVTPNGIAEVVISQIPKSADELRLDAEAVRDAFATYNLTPQPNGVQPNNNDQTPLQKDGLAKPFTKTAGSTGSSTGEQGVTIVTSVVPVSLGSTLPPNKFEQEAASLIVLGGVTYTQTSSSTSATSGGSHLYDNSGTPADILLRAAASIPGAIAGTLGAAGSYSFIDTVAGFAHTATAALSPASIAALTALGMSAVDIAALSVAVTASVTQDSRGRPDATGIVSFYINVPASLVGFLAQGQSLSLTYAIVIDDHQPTTTITHFQTFVVTGTNGAPTIDLARSLVSGTAANLGGVETAAGTVVFHDVNLADTHVVALAGSTAAWSTGGTVPAATVGALGSALKLVGTDSTGTGTGAFTWSFSAPASAFAFLSAGETLTLTYQISTTDNLGATVVQPVTVVVTGTNAAPVIDLLPATGTFSELAGVTNSTVIDTASGTIAFTDANLADVHSISTSVASVALLANGYSAPVTDASTLAALASLIHLGGVDSTGSGTGSVTWTVSAQDRTFDFLGAGESLVVTYAVTISDGQGGVATKPVVVTIVGSNDAPVIVARTTNASASITKLQGVTNSTNADVASGTIHFTDADAHDGHVISFALASAVVSGGGTLSSSAQATLAAALTLSGTNSTPSTPGTVNWNFSAPDSTFDFLGVGKTLTLTYTVKIDDGHGGIAQQPVVVTVNGPTPPPSPHFVIADKSALEIDIANNAAIGGDYVVHGVLEIDGLNGASPTLYGGSANSGPGTFIFDYVPYVQHPQKLFITYSYTISQADFQLALSSNSNFTTINYRFAAFDSSINNYVFPVQNIRVNFGTIPAFSTASPISIVPGDAATDTIISDHTKTILSSSPHTLSFAPKTGQSYSVGVQGAEGDIGTVVASVNQAGRITWTYNVDEAEVAVLGPNGLNTDTFTLTLYSSTGTATTQQLSVVVKEPDVTAIVAPYAPLYSFARVGAGHSSVNLNFKADFILSSNYYQVLGGLKIKESVTIPQATTATIIFDQNNSGSNGNIIYAISGSSSYVTSTGQASGTYHTETANFDVMKGLTSIATQAHSIIVANPVALSSTLHSVIDLVNPIAVSATSATFAQAVNLSGSADGVLFFDGGGTFNMRQSTTTLAEFTQLVVTPGAGLNGAPTIYLANDLDLTVTTEFVNYSRSTFYLGDATYKFHGKAPGVAYGHLLHGDQFIITSGTPLQAADVFDEAYSNIGNEIAIRGYTTNPYHYDLTGIAIHNIDILNLSNTNASIQVTNESIKSFIQILGRNSTKISTSDSSLDLSKAHVFNASISSSSAAGTSYTADYASSTLIAHNTTTTGKDSLTLTGPEISAQQVSTLFTHDSFQFIKTGASLYAGTGGATLEASYLTTNLIGNTGVDTFVFKPGPLRESIINFTQGQDKLQFVQSGETFATLIAHAVETVTGTIHDTVLHLSGANTTPAQSITLHNVALASLHATDFIL